MMYRRVDWDCQPNHWKGLVRCGMVKKYEGCSIDVSTQFVTPPSVHPSGADGVSQRKGREELGMKGDSTHIELASVLQER
jgi:hypothetical protein